MAIFLSIIVHIKLIFKTYLGYQKTFDAGYWRNGEITAQKHIPVWKAGPSILGKEGLQASAQYREFSKNTCLVLSSCQKSKSSAKVGHKSNREKRRAFLSHYDHDLPTLELTSPFIPLKEGE